MTFPNRTVSVLTALFAFAPLTQAASGGIDSFWSSASKVRAGDTVDFSAVLWLETSQWSGGGSSPEPAPQWGHQEWNANWSYWEYETLTHVWLQAAGESFSDLPSTGAGQSYSNIWSFSVTFIEAGTFNVDLSGGWQAAVQSGYSYESASRNCAYIDPAVGGDLYCDSWDFHFGNGEDSYTIDGRFAGRGISIEVAAVPEPGTWAMMLAGVGLLAARTRRRR